MMPPRSPAARSASVPLPDGGFLTDVPGIKVGHCTLAARPTGCTVVLCDGGAVAGVDVRGSAPGTRETDLLSPLNAVERVNAILLSGGSAFGLDAAAGVMRYLEERQLGVHVAGSIVPIVPAAILMDLGVGNPKIRPDAAAGYQACLNASGGRFAEGCVGAGAGATVGKMFGSRFMMKSGLGTACVRVPATGLVVGAMVAVNAVGDVIDPLSGKMIAGARTEDGTGFRDTMAHLLRTGSLAAAPGANTTLGIVATNAHLSKAEMTKVAQMAHDGYARTINPIHTMSDGDTIFALSSRVASMQAEVTTVGAIAAMVVARAVVRAVMQATSIPELGLIACRDYLPAS